MRELLSFGQFPQFFHHALGCVHALGIREDIQPLTLSPRGRCLPESLLLDLEC